MILALFFHSLRVCTFFPALLAGCPEDAEGSCDWSNGIDIQSEHSLFVTVPGLSDVKVQSQHRGLVTHVHVHPISRAEVSAREIRSRIKGKDTKVIIVEVQDQSASSPGGDGKESAPSSPDNSTRSAPSYPSPDNKKRNSKDDLQPTPRSNFELQRSRSESPRSKSDRRRSSSGTTEGARVHLEVGILFKQCCFVLVDELSVNQSKSQEIARVIGDNVFLAYYTMHSVDHKLGTKQALALCVGDLQIDNQMQTQAAYDFAVLFQKQDSVRIPKIDEVYFKTITVIEKLAVLKSQSLIVADLILNQIPENQYVYIQGINISILPVALFIEDTFVYEVLKIIDTFIPTRLSCDRRRPIPRRLPEVVKHSACTLSSPIRLHHLSIQPIKMLLSVHASLKLFIASDHAPLTFGRFERKDLFTTMPSLARVLAMHYASGALFRAGKWSF